MSKHAMRLIPEGVFHMGGIGEGSEPEFPNHRLDLSAFWIDQAPVTNYEFADFVERSGYATSRETNGHPETWLSFATNDRMNHPVVMVSWQDANEFARFMDKRLPTEAEWEKSARGGLAGSNYPWGDEDPTEQLTCWARAKPGVLVPATSEVCSFPPNGYGLYDMVGNVWQWCQDFYDDGYYTDSPMRNPQGPPDGQNRVRRGGAWNVRESFRLRCSNRGAMVPSQAWKNLGFRCAKSA